MRTVGQHLSSRPNCAEVPNTQIFYSFGMLYGVLPCTPFPPLPTNIGTAATYDAQG